MRDDDGDYEDKDGENMYAETEDPYIMDKQYKCEKCGKKKTEKLEQAERVVDPSLNPIQEAHKSHDKTVIRKVINELPERHQKLLTLKYFSDLTVEELAQALGVTANNISVMTHRALAAFEVIYQRYV